MSFDSNDVVFLEEIHSSSSSVCFNGNKVIEQEKAPSASSRKLKSTLILSSPVKKKSGDEASICASLTPRKKTLEGSPILHSSTPSKFFNQEMLSSTETKITFSQDITNRPNKFFSSPTKSPSKKTSPVLSKFSPFRKNSPKFKHQPIQSYFIQQPKKITENSLKSILEEVKQSDEVLFDSLLSDDYDLSNVETDESLLSPPKQKASSVTRGILTKVEAASSTEDSTVSKTSQKSCSTAISSEICSNSIMSNSDLTQSRNYKKAKKMLFPDHVSSEDGKIVLNNLDCDKSNCDINLSQKPSKVENNLGSVCVKDNELENEEILGFPKFANIDEIVPLENSLAAAPNGNSTAPSTSSNAMNCANLYKPGTSFNCTILKSSGRNCEEEVPSESAKSNCEPCIAMSESGSQAYSSESSETSAVADSYSKCIESVLRECLLYFKHNLKHEIFVNLDELEKLIKSDSMHQINKRLYARLLINRKFKWYRATDLKNYENVLNLSFEDLIRELNMLEEEGLITSNFDEEDLRSMLKLLQMKELKRLCKFFRISDNRNKPDLIHELVNFQNKQSTLKFKAKVDENVPKNSILFKRMKELLGHCIKLCKGPREAFYQCLIFVTYPFFHGDPNTRLSDYMNRITQVQKNEISFPPFVVQRSIIFSSKRMFDLYLEALDLSENVFSATLEKDWETLSKLTQNLFVKLKEILADDEVCEYVNKLPSFLRRFTAGYVCANALFKSLVENKKNSEKNIIIKSLNLLLDQNLYLGHKKGKFYEELASVFQVHKKNNNQAMEIVMRGLEDSKVDTIMKHTLSVRGITLYNRKSNPLSSEIKQRSRDILLDNIPDPLSVTINARCLAGKPGHKQVYVSETDEGFEFSSVEELAKSYYKKLGFVQILHDEGGTLRSLIFACFWDVIYQQPLSASQHSVFHSPFQTHPLDWGSIDFYSNRQIRIEQRLADLETGGLNKVFELLEEVCEKHEDVSSVINWNYFSKNRLTLLKQFLSALSVEVFCKICNHLLKNSRNYGSGFPDLTMWNPDGKKCMFAEVKSPNDRLSIAQKLWLYNLNKMGALAEVCYIQTTASKKRKAADILDHS